MPIHSPPRRDFGDCCGEQVRTTLASVGDLERHRVLIRLPWIHAVRPAGVAIAATRPTLDRYRAIADDRRAA